ncbi:MAG: hypothetical protein ACRD8O_04710 [Bryobacteraceae bacterium]
MLRITVNETTDTIRLYLEGKLSGAWVAELEDIYTVRRRTQGQKAVVVDLENLTGLDTAGRYLLALIQSEGTAIDNANPLLAPLWSAPVSALRS